MPEYALAQPGDAALEVHALGSLPGSWVGLARFNRWAQVKAKHIGGLLPHAQVGEPQVAVLQACAHKAMVKRLQPLHMGVVGLGVHQVLATGVGGKAHGAAAVKQRIKPFVVGVAIHGHHAPEPGGQRRGGDQYLLGADARLRERCICMLRDIGLSGYAPADIGGADDQGPGVELQPAGAPRHTLATTPTSSGSV